MRRILLLSAVLLLAIRCGGDSEGAATLAEATERLRGLVDATAAAVAYGLPVTPEREAFAVTSCDEGADAGPGTYSGPYRVVLEITPGTDVSALFERTRDYWEDEGFDVGKVLAPRTRGPRMHAEGADGYGIVLRVRTDQARAYLDGSTPCVKDPARKPN